MNEFPKQFQREMVTNKFCLTAFNKTALNKVTRSQTSSIIG